MTAFAGPNDSTLPPAVRRQAAALRVLWVDTFNASPDDPKLAYKAAWGAVRSAIEKRRAGEEPAQEDMMPWKIVEEDGKFCVYKENAEGEPSEKLKCYPDKKDAIAYQRALYANVEEKQAGVSFKAFDQPDGRTRWVATSSGGFEDRDREVVSTDFLASAVALADRTKERGPLLIFHVPGAQVGTTDYQAVVGEPGFLLESGLFDDSEAGQRAAAYYKEHASETGVSIKFLYANRSPDGVYSPPGAILERSLMRKSRAAFPWSALQLSEVEKMAKLSREKREELEAVLGEDLAVTILDQLDANAQALKEAGVRAKAAATPEEGETTEEAALPVGAGEAPQAPEDEDKDEKEAGEVSKSATPLDGGEYELVLTDEALIAVAEKAASVVAGQIEQLGATLTAALDELNKLRTSVEKNAQDVLALQQSDETKIAEKVAHLPRATVRQIQASEYRATQAKEAAEPAEGDGAGGDYLARLKKVVHE